MGQDSGLVDSAHHLGTPAGSVTSKQQEWQLSARSSGSGGLPHTKCMPPFLRNFTSSLRRRASVVARRPRWMSRSRKRAAAVPAATKFKAAAIVADVVTALKQDAAIHRHSLEIKVAQAVANIKTALEGRELCIQVKGARNLVGADWAGVSNPYAKVRVDDNEQQTQHIRATLNPRWNNTFVFSQEDVSAPEAKGMVQIEVWSYDSFHPDDFLGQAQLDLSTLNLSESRAAMLRVPLVVLKPNGKKEHGDFGEMFLSVWTMPSTKKAVEPGEEGAVVDSKPAVSSMCGGNLHRQLPSMVHAGIGTLYEEPCVVFIKVTLVALDRLEALVEGRLAATAAALLTQHPHPRGSIGAPLAAEGMSARPRVTLAHGRHCWSRTSSQGGNAGEQPASPASPAAGGASGGLLSRSSTHSQKQEADEAVEGVSLRSNVLDGGDDLSDDEFDDSAMERESTGESSTLTDYNSMSAVLERLRGKLLHQDSTLSSSNADSDGMGVGPYVYCKVTYAKQSHHTRMMRLQADGSLHLNTSFVFCDVRPLHDRPLQIDVYATNSKKSRGRLVGQMALPLLDLAADCAAAEPGPGVKVAYQDGKGVVQLLAVSRGLEGRAGGVAVLHAGVADADNRAAIYCMELRADQPPTECKAFMEVAAVVTDTGAAITKAHAIAVGTPPSSGVVVEVPVADVAGPLAAAEASVQEQGAGAAVASAIADAAAGAQELLGAMVERVSAAGVCSTSTATITSAVSASSDGPFHRRVSGTSTPTSVFAEQQPQQQQQQQQQQEEAHGADAALALQESTSTSLPSSKHWLHLAQSSGGRTVALLQSAAQRIWRDHELPVSSAAPDVGKERVLSTLRIKLHSVELLTHLRGAHWCLVANVGPNWMITKPRSSSDSSLIAWEVMAPLYAPDSVLTIALFSMPTGIRVKETPTLLGKVRMLASAMVPGKDHSFTLLVPAHSGHSSGDSTSGNVASIRATLHVQYCKGWKDMVAAYVHAPRPTSFYELGLEDENAQRLEKLRRQIVFRWLEHAQPAIPQAMAEKVLESHRDAFSMRRLKTNYQRAIDAFGWLRDLGDHFDDICTWRHPGHSLAAVLVVVTTAAMPSRMFATLLLAVVAAMLWRYSKRKPQHAWASMQFQHSHADNDEGVDIPVGSIAELRRRYDQVASVALTVQNMMDSLATFSERFSALMSWQDPVASCIFAVVIVAMIAATVVLPGGLRTVMACAALYVMRPPAIRDALPPLPLLLFDKLPSAADVM